MFFNDRRKNSNTVLDKKNVIAAAKAGSIKPTNKVDKVPMENISKLGTKVFGRPTTHGTGKPKMVAPGSKKAARLQNKSEWAKDYAKKAEARYEARYKNK